ncbi:MAG TPA: hypothetical protein VLT82_23825 [Myxococcaceae bacterium]|nr:hypothetical protein [Myxococcaceae bacterium]
MSALELLGSASAELSRGNVALALEAVHAAVEELKSAASTAGLDAEQHRALEAAVRRCLEQATGSLERLGEELRRINAAATAARSYGARR